MPQIMSSYEVHQLYVATVLVLISTGLYVIALWRSDARPRILKTGALITLLGAGSYALSGVLYPLNESALVDSFIQNVTTAPFWAAIAYICYVLAANQAKKSPILERICICCPVFLGILWSFIFVHNLIFPASSGGSVADPAAPYPWIEVFRTIFEFFFLAVSAVVFGKEAVRRRLVPSYVMRVQHISLFLGSVSFCTLVANSFIAAVVQAAEVSSVVEATVLAAHLPIQLLTLAAGGAFYMVGLFLYHSDEEIQWIHHSIRKWVKIRHNIEVEFYLRFGGHAVGDSFTTRYFNSTAKSIENIYSSPQAWDSAVYLIKLLGYLTDVGNESEEIRKLSTLQAKLSRTTDVASRLFVKIEGNINYDITNDGLFKAIGPALFLTQKNSKLQLIGQEEWIQCAAVVAADAGYLGSEKKQIILNPANSCVKRSILDAYRRSVEVEEL